MDEVDGAARSAADDLVVRTVQRHADALLKLARRHSLCVDDAYDAYQRGLEVFLKHAPRLDPATAHSWLFTVVKREAWAVRDQRQRMLGGGDATDLDQLEARDSPSPEDRVLAFDDVARSAEALKRLKPQEVQALWLKASGRSYAEIADECGWTYTKVNRCITEGRRKFLDRYAEIESGAECERWAPALFAMVDGEADQRELAQARPHLRNCPACRATVRALHEGSSSLAIVLPAALAVGGGATHTDSATSLLVRIYEAVAGTLHERAVASALKVQAAMEAASVGKVTAVAASAAALAGGGAVVAETRTPSPPPPQERREAAATASLGPVPVAAAVVQRAIRALPAGAPSAAGSPAAREKRRGGRAAVRTPPSRFRTSVVAAAREFAPEGAASPAAPAAPQAIAASPRAAAPASKAPAGPSQSSAENEFTP